MERDKLSNGEALAKLGLDFVRYSPRRYLTYLKQYPLGVLSMTGLAVAVPVMGVEIASGQTVDLTSFLVAMTSYFGVTIEACCFAVGMLKKIDDLESDKPIPGSVYFAKEAWQFATEGVRSTLVGLQQKWDDYRTIR